MTGQTIKIGPFTGGLNKAADPTVVGDEDLIDCINFELDVDGALVNRPAISVIHEGLTDSRLLIFGQASFSGVNYLFGTQSGQTFVSSNLGSTWTELNPGSNSRECISMVVYANTVWMPATPGSANGGISWTPSGGAVAVSAMPRGTACVVHKNRLYICPGETATTNASRLHFSQAADFTDWPSVNFIDVAQGDGTTLNNVIVYQDNLLLFKSESTYVLAYDLNPTDAILKQANSVVGSHGNFGVVQHENTVYCMHHGKVYSIINFSYELINLKVPFTLDDSLPANTSARYEAQHLSLLGDRLVVRFFNKTYVYGLRTRTWSEWKKTDIESDIEWHVFGPLIRAHVQHGTGVDSYYTSYSFDMDDNSGYKIIRIIDDHTAGATEGYGENKMYCIATTKDFDMADPIRLKRLFWWGADILCGNEIVGSVEPITLVYSPTWAGLGDLLWSELNTWGKPLTEAQVILTTYPADGIFNTNKVVKFLKGLRFRKINFSVRLETTGDSTQIVKLFSILAIIKTKQTVSEGVS